jgi:hypothetical protein
LTNESGDKQSPQGLIRDMDKQDYIIEHMDTIFYFQGPGKKEYMARFAYRIGKDNVKLIKYEVK